MEFTNSIVQDKLCRQGQQHLRYNLKKWVKKGTFDILNDNSENLPWCSKWTP